MRKMKHLYIYINWRIYILIICVFHWLVTKYSIIILSNSKDASTQGELRPFSAHIRRMDICRSSSWRWLASENNPATAAVALKLWKYIWVKSICLSEVQTDLCSDWQLCRIWKYYCVTCWIGCRLCNKSKKHLWHLFCAFVW